MSCRLDGTTDYVQRTTAANLGNVNVGTMLAWYRKEDSTTDRDIMMFGRSGGGGIFRIRACSGWRSRLDDAHVQRRNAECAIGYRDEGAVPGNP